MRLLLVTRNTSLASRYELGLIKSSSYRSSTICGSSIIYRSSTICGSSTCRSSTCTSSIYTTIIGLGLRGGFGGWGGRSTSISLNYLRGSE
jgi:hypothetical protein